MYTKFYNFFKLFFCTTFNLTVQAWLSTKFKEKFVNKKIWPPCIPDLYPCDYFLRGHLVTTAYNPLPNPIGELKTNIVRDCNELTSDILKPV